MNKKTLNKIIGIAIQQATKSNMRMRHGAVILRRNKVIATGFNVRQVNRCAKYSVHAEESALNSLFCINKRRKYDRLFLYVIRLMDNGSIANSKPCNNCRQKLNNMPNIVRVFYSC